MTSSGISIHSGSRSTLSNGFSGFEIEPGSSFSEMDFLTHSDGSIVQTVMDDGNIFLHRREVFSGRVQGYRIVQMYTPVDKTPEYVGDFHVDDRGNMRVVYVCGFAFYLGTPDRIATADDSIFYESYQYQDGNMVPFGTIEISNDGVVLSQIEDLQSMLGERFSELIPRA